MTRFASIARSRRRHLDSCNNIDLDGAEDNSNSNSNSNVDNNSKGETTDDAAAAGKGDDSGDQHQQQEQQQRQLEEEEDDDETDDDEEEDEIGFRVPNGEGLLIYLSPAAEDAGRVYFGTEPHAHHPDIHENCYAPASLTDVRLLMGGGSGVAVFHGHHPILRSTVMKHGGHEDFCDVLALSCIAQELHQRGGQNNSSNSSSNGRDGGGGGCEDDDAAALAAATRAAADDLRARIPGFSMIYISSHDVRDRSKERWNTLRQATRFSIRTLSAFILQEERKQRRKSSRRKRHSRHNSNQSSSIDDTTSRDDDDYDETEANDDVEFAAAQAAFGGGKKSSGSSDGKSGSSSNTPSLTFAAARQPNPPAAPPPPLLAAVSSGGRALGTGERTLYVEGTTDDSIGLEVLQRRVSCLVPLLEERQQGQGQQSSSTQQEQSSQQPQHCKEEECKREEQEEREGQYCQRSSSHVVVDGYAFLRRLLHCPVTAAAMRDNHWKITLGQKTIGGPNSKNGAHMLTEGRLKGRLLDKLVREFTTVMSNLDLLTYPAERDGVAAVRAEVRELVRRHRQEEGNGGCGNNDGGDDVDYNYNSTEGVYGVSKEVDQFVGACILKNFEPVNGRFHNMVEFGQRVRDGSMILTEEEKLPATFLGNALRPGASLDEVFHQPPAPTCALDHYMKCGKKKDDGAAVAPLPAWLRILECAVSEDLSSRRSAGANATNRVWTCGLTDAGLQNTFLSADRGLELFDLGEPQLMSQPAFLTKFLFSFFHAFGMHEEQANTAGSGSWVVRFRVEDEEEEEEEGEGGDGDDKEGDGDGDGDCKQRRRKVHLTDDTKELLPYMYEAYQCAVDYFCKNLFDEQEERGKVRTLLGHYTVLQLLSDASFCLRKYEQRGGGGDLDERVGDRAKYYLAPWLWRSLWDLYAACHVHHTLGLAEESESESDADADADDDAAEEEEEEADNNKTTTTDDGDNDDNNKEG